MPYICPRSCSLLASAAVFISIGVVQFIVGIILLKSKYVYLLAGPDFWTASCNIAVGCLLGVSASVWKQSRKRDSKKHVIRRHLLLALLFSALIMNATTLGILLLGKGNKLLSIRLESDENSDKSTFASEVLAYAYVASVCCPVVCIVVSIVAMSGSCFSSAKKSSIERKLPLGSLKKNRSRTLQWVYSQERPDLSNKFDESVLSTSSESSSDEDSDIPMQKKHANSVEELQSVLSRMARGKRDSILSDSSVMLRELDLRRKNRFNSLNSDGSYIKPVLSRLTESAASGNLIKSSLTGCRDSGNGKTGSSKRYSQCDEDAHVLSEDVNLKRISRSRNKRPDIPHRNMYGNKDIEHQVNLQPSVKNTSSQYRNLRGTVQARLELDDNITGYSSDVTDYNAKGKAVATYNKSRKRSKVECKSFGDKSALDTNHQRKSKDSSPENDQMISEKKGRHYNHADKIKETSQDYFSPDGSDFSPDTTFEIPKTRSSWAGEIVPINLNNSTLPRLSHKLIQVASPVIPSTQQEHDLPKLSDDSGISSIQSNSFSSEIANQNEFKTRERNLSSFGENPKMGNNENMQEYPKAGSQSSKKYDLSRVVTMAPISEEPNTEQIPPEEAHCASFYETTPRTSKSYFRQQSLPSVVPGSSREVQRDDVSSEVNGTPKRKRSASGKVLRKLWSVASSDNHTDFLDLVVDKDSLIGLSEEELIARQLKNRSIRKAVQQRMKEETFV